MKNLLLLLLIVFGIVACEREINLYNGENGIYFGDAGVRSDTIRVQWGLKNSDITKQSVRLRVCLFGNVADYDRKFNIEIHSDEDDPLNAVEGIDYEPFTSEYVMPANTAETYINIDLLRTEVLKAQPKRLLVKLVENEELKLLYSREDKFYIDSIMFEYRKFDFQRVIVMSEEFPIPIWWNVFGINYFGEWSPKKSALICEVMNIDRELFVSTDLTKGYWKFVGKYMHRWLQENPQTEEDGSPMEMGVESQG